VQFLELVRRHGVEVIFVHQVEHIQRLRNREGDLDGVVIDLFHGGGLAIPRPGILVAGRVDVVIQDVAFPDEQDVIRGEGHAVGPESAFDQVHGQDFAVIGPFPALGDFGHWLDILGCAVQRAGFDQRAVAGRIGLDAEPAHGRARQVVVTGGRAGRESAPHIAIHANAIFHAGLHHDCRLFGQALLNRGQAAIGDELIQPGGLLVRWQALVLDNLIDGQFFDLRAANFDFVWIRVGNGRFYLSRWRRGGLWSNGGGGRLGRLGLLRSFGSLRSNGRRYSRSSCRCTGSDRETRAREGG